ncbi:8897_t:CDS:1 [Racocetra persica]|uniref:8897_t:CDS:1 n=1 Tax=Racocetra persica TaxID=160502 RepID=A0ACA9PWH7_9GLOM|nr:8897_t:CDS:1 [Racocetra persica]
MNKQVVFPHGFPRQGEIYKVYFSKKGKEIGKIRPAMVISNNIQNEFDDQIVVAPLTSEIEEVKKERPFTVLITKNKQNGLEKDSKILLNRVQTIDIKLRLRGYVGYTGLEIIAQIQEALKVVFNMNEPIIYTKPRIFYVGISKKNGDY